MTNLIIRSTQYSDRLAIKMLYQEVAKIEGGLARSFDEITDDYIKHNLQISLERGITFVATQDGEIVGEIHASRPIPSVFSHVLSDLTIAVHPTYQTLGIGRKLFSTFLEEVSKCHQNITRVELMARESNHRALRFYASLGFCIEGRFEGRMKTPAGHTEADIAMAWLMT
jgi:ribosomal protein S18 acetylase RimI-like enzyme